MKHGRAQMSFASAVVTAATSFFVIVVCNSICVGGAWVHEMDAGWIPRHRSFPIGSMDRRRVASVMAPVVPAAAANASFDVVSSPSTLVDASSSVIAETLPKACWLAMVWQNDLALLLLDCAKMEFK
jgi:hypothetical protein